jgi:hypothetical protein
VWRQPPRCDRPARILDLLPNEERLLLGTEVKPEAAADGGRLTHLKGVKGVLHTTTKLRETKTYSVRDRNPQGRAVLIGQPVKDQSQRVDTTMLVQTARNAYRFEAQVPAGVRPAAGPGEGPGAHVARELRGQGGPERPHPTRGPPPHAGRFWGAFLSARLGEVLPALTGHLGAGRLVVHPLGDRPETLAGGCHLGDDLAGLAADLRDPADAAAHFLAELVHLHDVGRHRALRQPHPALDALTRPASDEPGGDQPGPCRLPAPTRPLPPVLTPSPPRVRVSLQRPPGVS